MEDGLPQGSISLPTTASLSSPDFSLDSIRPLGLLLVRPRPLESSLVERSRLLEGSLVGRSRVLEGSLMERSRPLEGSLIRAIASRAYTCPGHT